MKRTICNIVAVVFLIPVLISSCESRNPWQEFQPTSQDSISLIQSLLDNKMLYDSLFSEQISQSPIAYKDNRIPAGAAFTYQGKPVLIREEKIEKKYIDFEHPRFIIAFADCIIKKDSAELTFEMPDVGLGVSTNWMRSKQTDPWKLIDWSIEHY